MKKAKKLIPLLLCLCLILSGCAAREAEEKDSSKLQIVCTNFPAYDFAREIAGNRAQIKRLIKPGAEVHSYEPAPKEVIAMLNPLADKLLCVRGNCDCEVDQMVLTFPILADYSIFPVGSRLIYATHGHVYNTSHLPPLCPGDILLHGHTHVPAWEPFGENNLYLHPGSVSIPKSGSAHSYMTLEDGVFEWKTLSGEVYHTLTL